MTPNLNKFLTKSLGPKGTYPQEDNSQIDTDPVTKEHNNE